VDVEFLTEYGDLPMMKAYTGGIQSIAPALAALTGTAVMNIVEYQKGARLPALFGLLTVKLDCFETLNPVHNDTSRPCL
jgi:hypothetical protein